MLKSLQHPLPKAHSHVLLLFPSRSPSQTFLSYLLFGATQPLCGNQSPCLPTSWLTRPSKPWWHPLPGTLMRCPPAVPPCRRPQTCSAASCLGKPRPVLGCSWLTRTLHVAATLTARSGHIQKPPIHHPPVPPLHLLSRLLPVGMGLWEVSSVDVYPPDETPNPHSAGSAAHQEGFFFPAACTAKLRQGLSPPPASHPPSRPSRTS